MTEFEIAVAGEQAQLLSSRGQLTYRMAGAKLIFSFDGEWDALTPYALIRQGDAAVAIPVEKTTAIIPGHALTMVGDFVYAGVYGVSADGTVAIPTVWVRLGRLRDGAHIFYDEDTLPNTPIWQTMGEQMGDISRLQTPEKTSLVDAVNSISAESLGAMAAPSTGAPGQLLAVAGAEQGRPTAWETVDLPDNSFRLLKHLKLTEDVSSITVNTDSEGNPFGVKELAYYLYATAGAGIDSNQAYYVYPGSVNAGALRTAVTNGIYAAGKYMPSSGVFEMLTGGRCCTRVARNSSVVDDKVGYHAALTQLSGINLYTGSSSVTFGAGTELYVWGR